jgi:hypothetical protein
MAVSANSKHPEKALQVYDLLRNDEEAYRLINYGIEGTDYVITDDGELGYPEGYDASTDALGANFWAGRRDALELDKVTDAPNKDEIYDGLSEVAKDYPYATLQVNKDAIDPTLAAMAGVLSQYLPQLAAGKYDDPAAAVAEIRQALKDAGYEDARDSIQADIDAWNSAG